MHFVIASGLSADEHGRLERALQAVEPNGRLQLWNGIWWSSSDSVGMSTVYNDAHLFLVTGWLRDSRVERAHQVSNDALLGAFTHDEWPLPDDITGDYAGVHLHNGDVRIFSSLQGVYPVYCWYQSPQKWLISTQSLLLARTLHLPLDPVGLAQSISPPFFVTYGARTLYKGVRRILPGERLKWTADGRTSSKHDNTLFADRIERLDDEVVDAVWDVITRDAALLIQDQNPFSIAMSGGWDSRLLLAALDEKASNGRTFFTYGYEPSGYEVNVARQCAETVNGTFTFCDIRDSYFPDCTAFKEQVLKTESVHITPWFAVLHRHRDGHTIHGASEWMLMGELFEAVPGRNAKSLSSRDARMRTFLTRPSSQASRSQQSGRQAVDAWKEWTREKTIRLQAQHFETCVPEHAALIRSQELLDGLREDVDELYRRMDAHELTNVVQYDELFHWYTNGRMAIARQLLALQPDFMGASPTQSVRVLRLLSRIPVESRVSQQLQQALIKRKVRTSLGRLPSAQVPYLPSSAPLVLKQLAWGLRAGLDQMLIRRMMKSKKPESRQRVVRSIDYRTLYAREDSVERVRSWFHGTLLSEEYFVKKTMARASMREWPLANIDIVAPANAAWMARLASENA